MYKDQTLYCTCSSTDKRNETIKYLPVENVTVKQSEEGSERVSTSFCILHIALKAKLEKWFSCVGNSDN